MKELKRPNKEDYINKSAIAFLLENDRYIDQLEAKLQAVKDSLFSDEEIYDMRPSVEDLSDHAINVGKRIGIKYQRERTKKALE